MKGKTDMRAIPEALLQRLSDYLTARVGLHFAKRNWKELQQKMTAAMTDFGFDQVEEFIEGLLSLSPTQNQIEILAGHLTVGETYFFRERRAFEILEQSLLPGLIAARRKTEKRLRFWSAGCSTGEEAYSLAILIDRLIPDLKDWNVTILATDINAGALRKTEEGIYSDWSFRDNPPWFKEHYFYNEGTLEDITERKQAEKQLQETLESLRKAVGTTIQIMVSAVETRDPYTSGHQIRSADLARAIATEMGLPQEKIDGIQMAGSIHDIGKLSIPAEILSKPTKLSDIEFRLIKEHAWQGYEILKDVESPWPLAEIVRQHHERMDGSGYPRNLKGEEILIEARILAVADVVEAMASHRPYRPGLGIDLALAEIEKNRGICYDDAVVDACLRLFREKGFKLEET